MAQTSLCSIPDCGKPSKGRGLCQKHYARLRRLGDPLAGERKVYGDTCCVHACSSPSYSKGYCRAHYLRLWRYGSPDAGSTRAGEPLNWIGDHADHADKASCLLWPYVHREDGYGEVWVDGLRTRAHRAMCEAAHGPAPSSEHQAAHSCGKGDQGCVNPNHLRWATRTENMADCVDHGTRPWGERHGQSKLTAAQVAEIRSLRGVETQRVLAGRFGVCQMTISHIQRGITWNEP